MLTVDEINKLQKENVELKAYKDVNEDFKAAINSAENVISDIKQWLKAESEG